LGTEECKIPGGVGEAGWDVKCKGEREQEKMLGGERKRKRYHTTERERERERLFRGSGTRERKRRRDERERDGGTRERKGDE